MVPSMSETSETFVQIGLQEGVECHLHQGSAQPLQNAPGDFEDEA